MLTLAHYIVDYLHPKGFRIDRPEGNDLYSILLFKQPITIWQDGGMVNAPENSCMIFSRWSTQLYYNDHMDYLHDGVFFYGEDLYDLFCTLELPINRTFQIREPKTVSNLIKDIAAEYVLKEPHSPQILDLQLRVLLYKLSDLHSQNENLDSGYYKTFQELRREVFHAPEQNWSAPLLANEVHLSVSRFQHLYQSFFGSTLTQDLIQSRIEHAQYLLRSSSAPISEIAVSCGYNSTEHFLRQFKKYMGVTPGKYRNMRM